MSADLKVPSLHRNLPRYDYDRIRAVNWSKLKHIGRSPAHYRNELYAENNDTDARKLGRCVHLAVLEPHLYPEQVAVWRGGRRYGKEWDAFCDANEGKEIIREEDDAFCTVLATNVRGEEMAKKYLPGDREVTLLWRLEGFTLKARPDLLARCGAVVDLKTTRDASPTGFGRECWRYEYHAQLAMYVDGVEAVTGQRVPAVLIAVENVSPYVVQVYRIPEPILEMGRDRYRVLLAQLAHHQAEDRWPGYADGELDLELPRWAMPFNDDENLGGLDLQFATAEGE